MPTYNFRNKQTGEITEEILSFAGREARLLDENIEQVHLSPPSLSKRGRTPKPDSGFRDVLKNVKKKHPGSNINTF